MFKWLIRGGALVAVSVMLGSCESMVLPDFNGGMLIPDIRFLKAGEVMNGVKCAMTEFMREREEELINERVQIVLHRHDDDEAAKKFLLLYGSEYGSELQTGQARILLQSIRRAGRRWQQ